MLVPFGATWAPCGRVKRCENDCKHRHPDVGPLSSQKSTKIYKNWLLFRLCGYSLWRSQGRVYQAPLDGAYEYLKF
jgi:hypothetical protein